MIAGLDFGTSNSAIGVSSSSQIKLLDLEEKQKFLPSTLYTYDRNFVCDYIDSRMSHQSQDSFRKQRYLQLNSASRVKNIEGYESSEPLVFFGREAFSRYIESPEEGIFIKSPKSFLGASGLSDRQVAFFEDLVTAKMLNIKQIAEQQLGQALTQVVIGRPVNFQGVDSHQSNHQAINIMSNAALRCGYKDVEFLFEPLAAGIDFESGLQQDRIVLVVDIGGGTTDCSMVKMGPSYVNKQDRSADFLAHSGRRIGGNDFDIGLTFQKLMPLFGLDSFQKNGLPIPSGPYWSAAAVNHVAEQTRFYSLPMKQTLLQLKREACNPKLIERFIHLRESKLNYRLTRSAEMAKIALSEFNSHSVTLDYIESSLETLIDREQFEESVSRPLDNIESLIRDCVLQANTQPEFVYITGGSAKSPQVKAVVKRVLPNCPILDGDYYGSVAIGLTKWANKIWR